MQDAWDGAVSFCISFRAGWDVAGWGPTYYPSNALNLSLLFACWLVAAVVHIDCNLKKTKNT